MSTLVIPKLVLDNTMGAQVVGVLLAAFLYGISCIQTWFYYSWYPNDRWQLRLLVALSFTFDTCHQALISHTIYIYLVKNFNNPEQLGKIVWSLVVEVMFNGLVALCVQSFYAYRIFRLCGRKYYLTAAVVILVAGEFVVVMIYAIMALRLETFKGLSHLKHLSMVVNVLAAAGDVLIAGILCVVLHRSRTGYAKSDTVINRLITFAVNTGLLTGICAVMSLISIILWPDAFIYICFYFMLGRLYMNSLLATLNARKHIRGMDVDSEGLSVSLPVVHPTVTIGGTDVAEHGRSKRALAIRVDTTTQDFTGSRDEAVAIPIKSAYPHGADLDRESQFSDIFGSPEETTFKGVVKTHQFNVSPSQDSAIDIVPRSRPNTGR